MPTPTSAPTPAPDFPALLEAAADADATDCKSTAVPTGAASTPAAVEASLLALGVSPAAAVGMLRDLQRRTLLLEAAVAMATGAAAPSDAAVAAAAEWVRGQWDAVE